jgi:hypothetical protein
MDVKTIVKKIKNDPLIFQVKDVVFYSIPVLNYNNLANSFTTIKE